MNSMKRSAEYVRQLVDQAKSEVDTTGVDFAKAPVVCRAAGCDRSFRGIPALQEHAEAVHTFEDIRRLLQEFIREKYGREGNYNANPPVPGIWTWIEDLASDWVVFTLEEGTESSLLKASYSIVDGNVSLGEPVEVRRRTVYEPVNSAD